jgi:hypothetical protein
MIPIRPGRKDEDPFLGSYIIRPLPSSPASGSQKRKCCDRCHLVLGVAETPTPLLGFELHQACARGLAAAAKR